LVLADPHDENWVYLRCSGRQGGFPECTEPPSWFESYFISRRDLEVHSWLFTHNDSLSDAEVAHRRDALSKQLDLPLPGAPSGNAQNSSGRTTSLMGFIQTVQQRWYGENFDPLERDTFPKQVDVVDWLVKVHNLSKRQAEAIDIVTRPDQARRK
jgi:hypothetical protein